MSKRDLGDLNKWKFSGLLIHIMANVEEFTPRARALLNWLKMVFIRFSGFGGSFEAHTCF